MIAGQAGPAIQTDWSEHVRDARVLGRRLRYVDYGEGPPLLLVHGLGGCWQWWHENIGSLGNGHRVLAVDLPGFGESDQLPPPAEIATHAATVVALLDELGIERVSVGAHSMGGLVAMLLARTEPERLAGLILVNAGGVTIGPLRLAVIQRSFQVFHQWFSRPAVVRPFAYRPRLRRLVFAGGGCDVDAVAPALAAELVLRLRAPGFLDALVAAVRVAGEVRPEEVRVPTLIVWGSRDPILPIAQARALASRMPDARLEEFDDAGHCPMLERPARFNGLVRRFLADHVNDRSQEVL